MTIILLYHQYASTCGSTHMFFLIFTPMDRTDEYTTLIRHKQKRPPTPTYIVEAQRWMDIRGRIDEIRRTRTYSMLREVKQDIRRMKEDMKRMSGADRHTDGILRNLEIFVCEMLIDIGSMERGRMSVVDMEKEGAAGMHMADMRVAGRQERAQVQTVQANDQTITKKRVAHTQLTTQITELGQIMSDISLHINIQGESLRRIDEVVESTDRQLFGSVLEIERVWDSLKGRRRAIGWFIFVWCMLLLMYIIIRSM